MNQVQFPEYDIRTRKQNDVVQIFDVARRSWVKCTPEEWVRQHVVHYLIQEKKVPVSLISVEMPIKLNKMNRRCDIVVFSRQAKPIMVVECKAPEVPINQAVVDQAARYNLTVKAPFLFVSNGNHNYVFYIDFESGQTKVLGEIPVYPFE